MSDKKPLQIYPTKEQRAFMDKEAAKKGLSLNKYVIEMIDGRMKRAK